MRPADYWIDHLKLLPHPEGGFYKETYRSKESIPQTGLPERFASSRNYATAIYFLLRSQDRSMFHRIKSDEIWHFHYGSALHIHVIIDGHLTVLTLGAEVEKGESLQVVIPANCWFGAKLNSPHSYTLSTCTVAPGFDFNDFELADRRSLTAQFPQFASIITELTV
jgi:predicted cupin superfamily sugar epimerase